MTLYKIIPIGEGSGFHIGVVGNDGARHTMLGFKSIAEAEAWIHQDKRLTGGAERSQGQGTAA